MTIPIAVDLPANTVIEIPGLARIVVDEQNFANGRLVVNALHITVGGILSPLVNADVVISHAEAGIT